MSQSTDPLVPAGLSADPPVSDNTDGEAAEAPARVKEPSQHELDALPADRRLELLELERQRRRAEQDRQAQEREHRRLSTHQWINSGVLLIGALLAGGSLIATAVTLRTGQEELRTAREVQITDRYTKAVEQLGSPRRDVRTAAVYALERIAADSPRDRTTIRDVLAAFVREHDPDPTVKDDQLPVEPDTDVHAALTVLARRPADPYRAPRLDLHAVRTPGSQFRLANGANLADANLSGANLHHADLGGGNLTDAHLADADLRGAILIRARLVRATLTDANASGADLLLANLVDADIAGADLSDANLSGANLHQVDLGGTDLSGAKVVDTKLVDADLTDAQLHETILIRAILRDANLGGANLYCADLRRAFLGGADLTGANLTGANLVGVIWSDATVWPKDVVGGAERMRARSVPISAGLYRVRED